MFQKYIKISALLLLFSCKPDGPQFSEIPELKISQSPSQFKLNGKDSLVRIFLSYTDGDGDIGLNPSDTFAPYNFGGPFFYNLFINVYRIDNGVVKPVMIPATTDSVNFNDRIGNLTPTGKNKSIFGEITLNIKAEPFPGVQPDSMFYTIQIADRKLHKSNLLKTPVLSFTY